MHTDFRDEWLSKIGRRLNIQELAFDNAGLCQLSLDDELIVTLGKLTESENLVIFGQLPVENLSPELMQQMLMENRSYSKQNAPVLSMSENRDAVEIYFKLSPLELDASEDVMGLLIGYLEYWRASLCQ